MYYMEAYPFGDFLSMIELLLASFIEFRTIRTHEGFSTSDVISENSRLYSLFLQFWLVYLFSDGTPLPWRWAKAEYMYIHYNV